jgi:hypothetical protein
MTRIDFTRPGTEVRRCDVSIAIFVLVDDIIAACVGLEVGQISAPDGRQDPKEWNASPNGFHEAPRGHQHGSR